MQDTSFLRQVPFGGYPAGRAPMMYAPQPMYWPPQYVGQDRQPNRPTYEPPFDPFANVRPISETLALAAVSFALFGGLGAIAGWLIGHTTKSAVVGAYLGLAALQGSSAIRRSGT